MDIFMKRAFTLAEVLITLGIIGVVAALTLPSVIKNYQHKALETAFKKSYTNLYNALNKAMIDSDFSEIQKNDGVDSNPPIKNLVLKQYKKVKNKISIEDGRSYVSKSLTYEKKDGAYSPQTADMQFDLIDVGGSAIFITQNSGLVWVVVDTNGFKKRPNAYGHDIFFFIITKNGKLLPATAPSLYGAGQYKEQAQRYCQLNSSSSYNGTSCAYYAIQNICPYDETKTYWECLP